jgi:hypothetical protein
VIAEAMRKVLDNIVKQIPIMMYLKTKLLYSTLAESFSIDDEIKEIKVNIIMLLQE